MPEYDHDSDHHDSGLDRRLREHGARWRASLPPAPDPTTTRSRRARSARWQALAAVAAVVLVVAGTSIAVATLDRGDHRALPPTAPSASASASLAAGVVPWQALPATDPSLPATTVPASPDPADAEGVRPCATGDLRARIGRTGAAMGTASREVVLTLVGSDPCRLSGFPTVEALSDGNRLALPIREDEWFGTPWRDGDPVKVAPEHPAAFMVAWSVSHSCPVVDNDSLRITLPGIATPFTVPGFGTSTCEQGESGAAPLLPGSIHPAHVKPGRVASPYNGVRASGDLPTTAQPGAPVDFTVTLTSRHDLTLDPCPDYSIITNGSTQRYALNCAAVPHRDAQGRPYLPAGVPVTFAMRGAPLTTGPTKLIWNLETSVRGQVGVGGVVFLGGEVRTAPSMGSPS